MIGKYQYELFSHPLSYKMKQVSNYASEKSDFLQNIGIDCRQFAQLFSSILDRHCARTCDVMSSQNLRSFRHDNWDGDFSLVLFGPYCPEANNVSGNEEPIITASRPQSMP